MAENENTFVILQSLLTCVCVSERTRDRAAASTERKQKARDPKAPISIWNFEGRRSKMAAALHNGSKIATDLCKKMTHTPFSKKKN